VATQRARPCALRLQVEELAPVVAGIAGEKNCETDEGEQEGDDRSSRQRGERAASERIGAKAVLER
jgi:hypothetical protein